MCFFSNLFVTFAIVFNINKFYNNKNIEGKRCADVSRVANYLFYRVVLLMSFIVVTS